MADQTFNEDLRDALLRHKLDVLDYSEGLSDRAVALLNSTNDELSRIVLYYLNKLQNKPITGKPAQALLQGMRSEISALRGEAWDEISALVVNELRGFVVDEAATLRNFIRKNMRMRDLDVQVPDGRTLAALVNAAPISGQPLKDWLNEGKRVDVDRLAKKILTGLGNREGLQPIVGAVLNTAPGSAPSAVKTSAQRLASLINTAPSVLQAEAYNETFKANAKFIKQEVFHATLDAKTTAVCIRNDQKRFKVGEGPQPPLHFNCRSIRVPYIDAESLATGRAFDPSTEKTLVREYAKLNGIGRSNIASRAALPRGTKGDFDVWARKRRRELIGRAPRETDYNDWFSRQSKEFQNDKLGKVKAAA